MHHIIRLMTHNVWNRDDNDPVWEKMGADCSAAARAPGLIRVYKETTPDIIGGQEVSPLMADLLKVGCQKEGLDYTMIWGRYTPILYRADRFELLDAAFEPYPEIIPGYGRSFNDSSKAWNLAVFRDKKNDARFIFSTTHLWWRSADPAIMSTRPHDYQAFSDEAREYQIQLLCQALRAYQQKYHCPIVSVGDFNTDYNSRAIRYMLKNGFEHAHDIATDFAEESVGYHNCFPWGFDEFYSDAPFEKAIDHILLCDAPTGAVKRFCRHSPDYYFPISDHSAAYIDLDLG